MSSITGRDAARTSPLKWVVSLFLFVICAGFYLSNKRTLAIQDGYDSLPNRVIPFSLLRFHTFALDPFQSQFKTFGRRDLGYLIPVNGHWMSVYPIGTPLLAVPFYAPAFVRLLLRHQAVPESLFWSTQRLEKLTSVLIAALSVVVLFHVLLERTGLPVAAVASLVFGLATSVWAIASQMLWQHGPGILCLTLGLFFLTRGTPSLVSAVAAGFWLGFAAAIRPQSVVFLLAGLGAVAAGAIPKVKRARVIAAFSAGAALILAVPLLYNLHYFGNILGGYGGQEGGLHLRFLLEGIPGLLLSPNRGLLVFTPVATVGIIGMVRSLRRPGEDPVLAAFTIAAIVFVLIHAAFYNWAGGWTFGPRYLTELLPILALASATILPKIRKTSALALGVLAIWSFLVQIDGAFFYPASNWNGRMGDDIEGHAWDFRHIELWEDFQSWKAKR